MRTITNPANGDPLDGPTMITALQTLETEIAHTSTGHKHDGSDSRRVAHTDLSAIGTNTHAQIDTALSRLASTSGINTGDQTDATLPFTDVTTNNVSTTKHGYAPKGTNVGKFLRDDGSWAYKLTNYSTTAQTPSAATLTQIAGSSLAIPSWKLQIGTIFRWTFDMTKTAAGTASSTFDIRIGTNNSTADTAVITFTKPAGSAAADVAFVTIIGVVRGPLSSSCVMSGNFQMTHNLASTGHATIPCVVANVVSSTFNATTSSLYVSLSMTSGASDAITIQSVTAEGINI